MDVESSSKQDHSRKQQQPHGSPPGGGNSPSPSSRGQGTGIVPEGDGKEEAESIPSVPSLAESHRSLSIGRKRTFSDAEMASPTPASPPFRPLTPPAEDPELEISALKSQPVRRRASSKDQEQSEVQVQRWDKLVSHLMQRYAKAFEAAVSPATRLANAVRKKSLPAAIPRRDEEDDFGGLYDVVHASAPMSHTRRAPVTAGGPRPKKLAPSSPGSPVRTAVEHDEHDSDHRPFLDRFQATEDPGLVAARPPSKLPRGIVHEALETTYSEYDDHGEEWDTEEEEDEMEQAERRRWGRRLCKWVWRTFSSWFKGDLVLLTIGLLCLAAYFIVENVAPGTMWQGAAVKDWLLVAALAIFVLSGARLVNQVLFRLFKVVMIRHVWVLHYYFLSFDGPLGWIVWSIIVQQIALEYLDGVSGVTTFTSFLIFAAVALGLRGIMFRAVTYSVTRNQFQVRLKNVVKKMNAIQNLSEAALDTDHSDELRNINIGAYAQMSRYIQSGQFKIFNAAGEIITIRGASMARREARSIFDRLDRNKTGRLSKYELRMFMDDDEVDAIFRALDYVVQRYITRREFILATARVWEDMHGLAHTLQDFSAVTRALKFLADTVYFIILLVVVFILYDLDFFDVVVSLGTFLVAFSFAIGSTVTDFIESVVFILGVQPYDVGDRITIDHSMIFIVQRIDLLTTTFKNLNNRLFIIPNRVLAKARIENQRRSPMACVELITKVGYRTTAEQLDALQKAQIEWVRKHRDSWRETAIDHYVYEAHLTGQMVIAMWVAHRLPWQEGQIIWGDIAKLVMFTKDTMQELGMEYVEPPRPLCGHPDATYIPAGKTLPSEPVDGSSGGSGALQLPKPSLSQQADLMPTSRPTPAWKSQDVQTVVTNDLLEVPSIKAMRPPAYGNTVSDFHMRKTVPIFPQAEAILQAREAAKMQEAVEGPIPSATPAPPVSLGHATKSVRVSVEPPKSWESGGLKGGMINSSTPRSTSAAPSAAYSPTVGVPPRPRVAFRGSHGGSMSDGDLSTLERYLVETQAGQGVPVSGMEIGGGAMGFQPAHPAYSTSQPGPPGYTHGPMIPEVHAVWPQEYPVPAFSGGAPGGVFIPYPYPTEQAPAVSYSQVPQPIPAPAVPEGTTLPTATQGNVVSVGQAAASTSSTAMVQSAAFAPVSVTVASDAGPQPSSTLPTPTPLGVTPAGIPDKVYPGWVLPGASAQWQYDLPDMELDQIRMAHQRAMYASRAIRSFKDEMAARFDPRTYARLYPEIRSGSTANSWDAVGTLWDRKRRYEAMKQAERTAKKEERKVKRQMQLAHAATHMHSKDSYPRTEGAQVKTKRHSLEGLFAPLGSKTAEGPPLSGFVPKPLGHGAEEEEHPVGRKKKKLKVRRMIRRGTNSSKSKASGEGEERKEAREGSSEETKHEESEKEESPLDLGAANRKKVKRKHTRDPFSTKRGSGADAIHAEHFATTEDIGVPHRPVVGSKLRRTASVSGKMGQGMPHPISDSDLPALRTRAFNGRVPSADAVDINTGGRGFEETKRFSDPVLGTTGNLSRTHSAGGSSSSGSQLSALDGKVPWHKRLFGRDFLKQSTPKKEPEFAGLLRRHREKLKLTRSSVPMATPVQPPAQQSQLQYQLRPVGQYPVGYLQPAPRGFGYYAPMRHGYVPTGFPPFASQGAMALPYQQFPSAYGGGYAFIPSSGTAAAPGQGIGMTSGAPAPHGPSPSSGAGAGGGSR